MDSFENIVRAVRSCTPEQKQRIFNEIRDSILIHNLERTFGVRAEVILEAISRANDLTQRGVRGVIAETVFVLDVLPNATGWQSDPPVGDLSYDACLHKNDRRVRIQVKTQRRKAGAPMRQRGSYVVEVQRTRTGQKDGVSARPYRFGEFDLLAVCMWLQPETGIRSCMLRPRGSFPVLTTRTSSKRFSPCPTMSTLTATTGRRT